MYFSNHDSWRTLGHIYGWRLVFSVKGWEPGDTQCFPLKYFYTRKISKKWTPRADLKAKEVTNYSLRGEMWSGWGKSLLCLMTSGCSMKLWTDYINFRFSLPIFTLYHYTGRSWVPRQGLRTRTQDDISSHYLWAASCSRGWHLLPTIG